MHPREIEAELWEWFSGVQGVNMEVHKASGDKYAMVPLADTEEPGEIEINLTSLTEHLADFINQRGSKS